MRVAQIARIGAAGMCDAPHARSTPFTAGL